MRSLVQALFDTLCFRLPQLMASDNAAKFETFLRLELRLQDIVLCPLNPLKVIDQAVGAKFVTLAVKYRLIQTQVKRKRGVVRGGLGRVLQLLNHRMALSLEVASLGVQTESLIDRGPRIDSLVS